MTPDQIYLAIDWASYPATEPDDGSEGLAQPFNDLASHDPERRAWAHDEILKRVFWQRPSTLPTLLPLLLDCLRDPACPCRVEVLYLLAEAGHREGPYLTWLAGSDPQLAGSVREHFERGRPEYRECLRASDPALRSAAVSVTRTVGTGEAIAELAGLLATERDDGVVERVLHQLAVAGRPTDWDAVRQFLEAGAVGVRCRAAELLVRLGPPADRDRCVDLLADIAASDRRYDSVAAAAIEGVGSASLGRAVARWAGKLATISPEKAPSFAVRMLALLFAPSRVPVARDAVSVERLAFLRVVASHDPVWSCGEGMSLASLWAPADVQPVEPNGVDISASLAACGLPVTRDALAVWVGETGGRV
jgi:hypothetical protein